MGSVAMACFYKTHTRDGVRAEHCEPGYWIAAFRGQDLAESNHFDRETARALAARSIEAFEAKHPAAKKARPAPVEPDDDDDDDVKDDTGPEEVQEPPWPGTPPNESPTKGRVFRRKNGIGTLTIEESAASTTTEIQIGKTLDPFALLGGK